MSTGSTPRDDADLEAFLGRQSPVSAEYDSLERVGPPASLDEKILAAAKVAAKSAPKPVPKPEIKPAVAPVAGKPAPARPTVPAPAATSAGASPTLPSSADERRKRPRPPKPEADDGDAAPSRRPPWLMPAALAASLLVAVGLGFNVFMKSPSGTSDATFDGSLFAKRARERRQEDKAAAASAEQDAEVVELELAPLPPPPVFEAEGPQVQDLDAAIALIRKDLVLANQAAATRAEGMPGSPALEVAPGTAGSRGSAAKLADAAEPPVAAAPDAPSVVQPRERRLSKILELYDRGSPDLAGDSLEIFLRDFEDDPVSQRILGVKP